MEQYQTLQPFIYADCTSVLSVRSKCRSLQANMLIFTTVILQKQNSKDFECLMKLDVYVIACSIKMFIKRGVRRVNFHIRYEYNALVTMSNEWKKINI